EFAYPAAFGDLVTAIVAFAAIPLVLRGSRLAKPIVWVFNIFGTVDLVVAITMGDDLQRSHRNGASVLDPRFLGSAVTGDSLRDFCSAPTSLVELTIRAN